VIDATRTANDYETLRAAVLGSEPARGPDLGLVRHAGLASWLKAPIVKPLSRAPGAIQARASGASSDSAPAAAKLTRLIAGILVALATEPTHG
jgi:hypothetical protein